MRQAALNGAGNPSGMSVTPSQFCACSIGGAHVDCSTSCGSGTQLKYLEVDVSMPFATAINYPGLPTVINVNRTSIVRIQ
jgi:hypothetical protein